MDNTIIILILISLAYILYRGYKLGKFKKLENLNELIKDEPVQKQALFFPCIIEGNIDMPPMSDVKEAAIIDVKEAGLYKAGMTAEECMALCSMPVEGQAGWNGTNTFGGGGAFGGRYMTGSFHFEIDVNGQQIPDKSWVKIFSDEKFPVTGGITPDGTIAMGSIGGTQINGSIVSGKSVGKLLHGDNKHHIYGVINGTYNK